LKIYGRFLLQNRTFYGIIDHDTVQELAGTSPENFHPVSNVWSLSELQPLPLCRPGKIIGTGLNYRNLPPGKGGSLPSKPKIFLKSPQAIVSSGQAIICPPECHELTAEVELAVAIGRTAKNVSPQQAPEYIWGYLTANDVTASDLQREDILWGRAKNFDTFLPLSQQIVAGADPSQLTLRCLINGQEQLTGCSRDMLQDIPHLISYLSQIMTLMPGDLILTGTPTGYGVPIAPGDRVCVCIDGIGKTENPVLQC